MNYGGELMLSIQKIHHSYDKEQSIFNDINLEIKRGEFVAIAGPNGSGKTTLIKLVCNLLKLQKGSITFNGISHTSLSVQLKTVYLPSDDYIPEFLTGREYIMLMSKLYKKDIDEQNLRVISSHLSMNKKLSEMVESYSHGMKKKLQLINALLLNPPLMIIDETLNGIDVEAKEIIKILLNEYTKNGGTIIICSHDLELMQEISNRVILLYKGEVYLDDFVSNLTRSLSDSFKDLMNLEGVKNEIRTSFQFSTSD